VSGISSLEESLQAKLQTVLGATGVSDAIAAAGVNEITFGVSTVPIRFRENLYDIGNSISHTADSTSFVINEAGTYQITYQGILLSEVLPPGGPINANLDLIGSTSGLLSTVGATSSETLVGNTVTAALPAGEILTLNLRNNTGSEVSVAHPIIAIKRIA
jgi:hypothetical protein